MLAPPGMRGGRRRLLLHAPALSGGRFSNKHSGGEALGWRERVGHRSVGLSKIKEAQGARLSPTWLSFCGHPSTLGSRPWTGI